MAVSLSDKLVQAPRGTVDEAIKYLKTPQSNLEFTKAYIRELWRLCKLYNIDFAFAFSQFSDETARGTSDAWIYEGNPAGIGIFPDGSRESMSYATGEQAARAQMVHIYAYILGKIPADAELAKYLDLDPRYDNVFEANWGGTVKKISDFGNGKWATNPKYAQQIVDHANAAFSTGASAPPSGGSTMGQTIDYSKLPFVMHVDLIPAWQTNNRPGLAMTPKSVTWHETANTGYGAGASMHNTWLHNGAPGAADTQVSVHFFVDDHEGYQTAPLNENTWHAGDGSNGTGNRTSISIECCVNSNGNLAKAQENVRALIAELLRQIPTIDDNAANSVVQHNFWSGKDCPHFLRAAGTWSWQLAQINALVAQGSKPASPWVAPSKIEGFDGTKDVQIGTALFRAEIGTAKTNQPTKVYQYATTSAKETHAPLPKDQGFSHIGWVNGEIVDGDRRWWITKSHSRIPVAHTYDKPEDKPAEPETEEPPKNEHGEQSEYGPKIVNGRPYYEIHTSDGDDFREITIVDDDVPLKKSVASPKPTKVAKKGDKFKAKMFTTGPFENGEDMYWVVTEGDEDPINKGLRVNMSHTDKRPS